MYDAFYFAMLLHPNTSRILNRRRIPVRGIHVPQHKHDNVM